MEQLLASLPKPVIALGAMLIMLMVIYRMSPPITICDAQMEIFRDSQKRFLYSQRGESGLGLPARFDTVTKNCMDDNSPGGCFELFQSLKKTVVDMRNIPDQCVDTAAEEPEIQRSLWKTVKLMVQLAWGERAPASFMQKNGWFDSSDVTLFCELKRASIRFYGAEKVSEWQEGLLQNMPKAEKLTREQVWPRSLLSTPCDSFR